MPVRARLIFAALALVATAGLSYGTVASVSAQQPAPAGRIFEVRTYVASAGKLDELKARFRDHTIRIFDRHDMKSVAYWTAADGPGATTTLTYIISHESREAAARNWAAFNADPEWVKVRTASNANGNIVARVDSYFANPTDFSPIK